MMIQHEFNKPIFFYYQSRSKGEDVELSKMKQKAKEVKLHGLECLYSF